MSFSEWINLRTGGQKWYNYLISPTRAATFTKFGKRLHEFQ